jgi:hypothetical protein
MQADVRLQPDMQWSLTGDPPKSPRFMHMGASTQVATRPLAGLSVCLQAAVSLIADGCT